MTSDSFHGAYYNHHMNRVFIKICIVRLFNLSKCFTFIALKLLRASLMGAFNGGGKILKI